MIAFEPVRRDHLPLLREWLGRERVRRWWRDSEQSLGHIEDALAGRDPTTEACVATVEEANLRSRRTFETAGFRHARDVEEAVFRTA